MLRTVVGLVFGVGAFAPVFGQVTSVAVLERDKIAVAPVASNAQEALVTVNLQQVPLDEAIRTIAKNAGVQVMFASSLLPNRRVDYRAKKVSVEQALAVVLQETGMRVRQIRAGEFQLIPREAVVQGTIEGKVIHSKTKQPIIGATVLLNGATKGVTTSSEGTFRLEVPAGRHVLHIRAVGFVKQIKPVDVVDEKSVVMEVILESSASVLDELIVTGTIVATERKAISNPITVITAEDIERRGVTRIEQLLRGEVPGVLALEQGSATYSAFRLGAMDTSRVYARGASRLDGGGTPMKTYVDGVELFDMNFLGSIDPQSIDRIEIVTGPQAATIYGSGAMGGVMQIFTKKGTGRVAPELVLWLKYGMLESNLSKGRTPTHSHTLKVDGGTGPALSYAASVSYGYSGQWQPFLFNRRFGASVGATHTSGPLTASVSTSTTAGLNGTSGANGVGPVEMVRYSDGTYFDLSQNSTFFMLSPIRSRSITQNSALNLDFRATSSWQHGVTVGRSHGGYELIPEAPQYRYPSDTLFRIQRSATSRTTTGYHTTATVTPFSYMSATVSAGFNGAWGDRLTVSGRTASTTASSWLEPAINQTTADRSVGGFGTTQIGLFERFFLTIGLRGERNPSYGREHKVDWTPTNGFAYSVELGELTAKALGSYGRATRAPEDRWRFGDPPALYGDQIFQRILSNDFITPEYSRGPQGGIEVYYGNIGALTVNWHRQTITDLVQLIPADTVFYRGANGNLNELWRWRWMNVATIRNQGWETTGELNWGPLHLKGAYSWEDSRVTKINPNAGGAPVVAGVFIGVPTHFGGATLAYAHHRTNVTVSTSFVGTTVRNSDTGPNEPLLSGTYKYRIGAYIPRIRRADLNQSFPGYVKTDLAISHRVSDVATLSANVTNLGNSFGSEGHSAYPALGRQVLLGLSMRFP